MLSQMKSLIQNEGKHENGDKSLEKINEDMTGIDIKDGSAEIPAEGVTNKGGRFKKKKKPRTSTIQEWLRK